MHALISRNVIVVAVHHKHKRAYCVSPTYASIAQKYDSDGEVNTVSKLFFETVEQSQNDSLR